MNAKPLRARHRHSMGAITGGLVAAAGATAITSLVLGVLLPALLNTSNILTLAALGVVALPVIALPSILLVVFVLGAPLWLLAGVFGWTGYRHATGAGVVVGVGMALLVPISAAPIAASAAAANLVSLGIAGAVAGFTARHIAGAPDITSGDRRGSDSS